MVGGVLVLLYETVDDEVEAVALLLLLLVTGSEVDVVWTLLTWRLGVGCLVGDR